MIESIWNKKSFLTFLLKPLSYLYYFFFKSKNIFCSSKQINVPVLCVGNVTLGGAGKTPTVIELRKILNKYFNNITVLTRGYKGKKKGPLIVKNINTFEQVGEESILHAQYGPTCMSKNKREGAIFCENIGSDLIIMDDGLQSINIKKNLNIMVVDSSFGFGNNNMLPAGPLREPVEECIKKSHLILIIGIKRTINQFTNVPKEKIFWAKKTIKINNLKKKNVYAFSALGNNQNFYDSLIKKGLKIIKFKSFRDHHIFSKEEINKIIQEAKKNDLAIVCTKKDFIKIPRIYQKNIFPVDLELNIENKKKLKDIIMNSIKN